MADDTSTATADTTSNGTTPATSTSTSTTNTSVQAVVSAVRYPDGTLSAIVKDGQGNTQQFYWHYLPDTKLPPIQLPEGVLMDEYVKNGGLVVDENLTVPLPVAGWNNTASIIAAPLNDTPVSITRLQGRLALSRAGMLQSAEDHITAAGGELLIWYQDAQTWRRDDPHVGLVAAALNLTSAEIDALFVAASGISL